MKSIIKAQSNIAEYNRSEVRNTMRARKIYSCMFNCIADFFITNFNDEYGKRAILSSCSPFSVSKYAKIN